MPALPFRLAAALLVLVAAPPAGAQQSVSPVAGPSLGITGTVRFHGAFPSRFVAPRNVEVWLPPDYDRSARTRYPVVYMQDGQNVFAPATSFGGVDWGVDETMTRLVAEHRVRPAIVVAIWNTAARFAEYMPAKAVPGADTVTTGIAGFAPIQRPLRSDDYVRFLVEELKPFIDGRYRTRPGRSDTFVMGSSMGGLISLYALAERPEVFGGAASLSTHWTAGAGAVVDYLAHALPSPSTHRLYFDRGTETLDAGYGPFQQRADSVVRAAGYVAGRNWVTRVIPGAEHSERAWRVRVAEPLVFLLGR